MTDTFQKFAKLRALNPQQIEEIEKEEKRVTDRRRLEQIRAERVRLLYG